MTLMTASATPSIASPQAPYCLPCRRSPRFCAVDRGRGPLGQILNASIGISSKMFCTRQKPITISTVTAAA